MIKIAPNGLQAAPDGLWIIDQVDLKIYKVDWETGDVLFEAQTDTEHSSGITIGGGYVWIASTFELQIAKVDMETGKTIVASWREGMEGASETGAHGLEWRNGKIYIASPPSQFVHVVDTETWTEEHAFRTPGLRNHGLAWQDDKLWVADTSAGTVNLLGTADGRVYDVIRVEAPDEVHGMTMHDGVLWYCDAHNCAIGRLIV
ncbi:MAG: hypothetical protein J4F29_22135 [Candidatus Latescibacteria bacterium]|nr:hypothetical protein [Candidatus Latescibacterota bacterium]